MSYRCIFLSAEGVNPQHVDEHLAVEPLRALDVAVTTERWDDPTVDWAAADAVVVRSTWDYQDRLDDFFATLAAIDARTALANPLELMRWNSRKTYLRDLADAGVPVVETAFGTGLTAARLQELEQRYGDGQWVVKPEVGANSSHVFRLTGRPSAEQRAELRATYSDRPYLAQPFVASVLDPGEYSVFFFDGELAHALLKTPASGDFRVQEDYGSNIRVIEPERPLVDAASAVLAALPDAPLYARIDLVEQAAGGYAVMEVELIEPSLYLRKAPPLRRPSRGLKRWLARTAR